jgi:hypothetical protein
MKKIVLPLILMIGLFIGNVSAQDGPYLTVYGAYALPMASSTALTQTITEASDSLTAGPGGQSGMISFYDEIMVTTTDGDGFPVTNGTTTTSKINLGKGLNFGAAFGYMFNDHVGAEIGFGYFLGSKNTFKQENRDEQDPANPVTTSISGDISAKQFRINPTLVVSTDFKDFVPYAKFGIILGVGTKVTENYSDLKVTNDVNVEQVYESKGGLAIGLNATIGALYAFNKKTGVFLELASTSMSYSPKKRVLTAYTIDGDDMLATGRFSLSSTETEYVKEVGHTDNDVKTNSTLANRVKYPFSSFEIKLGLRFSF